MANTRVTIPTTFGGVSTQPPALRHANQVTTADNVYYIVRSGMTKRPGWEHLFSIDSLDADGDYRLHAIQRDDTERYLMAYAGSTVRIFELDGTERTITWTTDAEAYACAESAAAADQRLITVADYTLLVNSNVQTQYSRSPYYEIEGEVRDFDVLVSMRPDAGLYFRTEADTPSRVKGHFLYEPGDATYATLQCNEVASMWVNPTSYSNQAAGGFAISFRRYEMNLSGCAWDESTKRLTKADAFADYSYTAGEQINVTGGTSVTADWYTIVSVNQDYLTLEESITSDGSGPADVTTDGIGRHVEVEVDMGNASLSDMHDVAAEFEAAIQMGGASDALVSWTDKSSKGYFTISGPYYGSESEVSPTSSPASGFDYTNTSTKPFSSTSGKYVQIPGTGDSDAIMPDVLDTWTAKPAPDQPEARFDPASMPIQITREWGDDNGVYRTVVLADSPIGYWRLGESSGTEAADSSGNGQHGEYKNTFTHTAASLLDDDDDYAAEFDFSTDALIHADKTEAGLGDFGSDIDANGFSFECIIKPDATNDEGLLIFVGETS